MIDIAEIKNLCNNGALRWTNHVMVRLTQRRITTDDVVYALQNGEIIEKYPTDYPYPSCLVLGVALDKRKIHVVCGFGKKELWLITAYYPNPDEWTEDFKTRKEN
ncbi:MAG: DUF4258 domain-containing protein [Defluviitaleaceae bacterium]|nr:DUF4258 domain-containing protein [Defluviitaleaceae bacterium]